AREGERAAHAAVSAREQGREVALRGERRPSRAQALARDADRDRHLEALEVAAAVAGRREPGRAEGLREPGGGVGEALRARAAALAGVVGEPGDLAADPVRVEGRGGRKVPVRGRPGRAAREEERGGAGPERARSGALPRRHGATSVAAAAHFSPGRT